MKYMYSEPYQRNRLILKKEHFNHPFFKTMRYLLFGLPFWRRGHYRGAVALSGVQHFYDELWERSNRGQGLRKCIGYLPLPVASFSPNLCTCLRNCYIIPLLLCKGLQRTYQNDYSQISKLSFLQKSLGSLETILTKNMNYSRQIFQTG